MRKNHKKISYSIPFSVVLKTCKALLHLRNKGGPLKKIGQAFDSQLHLDYLLWTLESEEAEMDKYLATLGSTESPSIFGPIHFALIVTTYGIKQAYLEEFFESLFDQTYQNFTICLCNDGDLAVADYLRNLSATNPGRVLLIENEQNKGICAGTKKAMELAPPGCNWFVFADADDKLHRRALEICTKLLESKPSLEMAFSDHDMTTDLGFRFGRVWKPDETVELMHTVNCINHLKIFKRDLIGRLENIFPEDIAGSQDWDLCLKALKALNPSANVERIPFPLYHWRMRPGSVATSSAAKPWAVEAGIRVRLQHLGDLGGSALSAEDLGGAMFSPPSLPESSPFLPLRFGILQPSGRAIPFYNETNAVVVSELDLNFPEGNLDPVSEISQWLRHMPDKTYIAIQPEDVTSFPLRSVAAYLAMNHVAGVVPKIIRVAGNKGSDHETVQGARNSFSAYPQRIGRFALRGLVVKVEVLRDFCSESANAKLFLLHLQEGNNGTNLQLFCDWCFEHRHGVVLHPGYTVELK